MESDISQIFNSIQNFDRLEDIRKAITSLPSCAKRQGLLDKLIKRKEELQELEHYFRFQKMLPVLIRVKRKFMQKLNVKKELLHGIKILESKNDKTSQMNRAATMKRLFSDETRYKPGQNILKLKNRRDSIETISHLSEIVSRRNSFVSKNEKEINCHQRIFAKTIESKTFKEIPGTLTPSRKYSVNNRIFDKTEKFEINRNLQRIPTVEILKSRIPMGKQNIISIFMRAGGAKTSIFKNDDEAINMFDFSKGPRPIKVKGIRSNSNTKRIHSRKNMILAMDTLEKDISKLLVKKKINPTLFSHEDHLHLKGQFADIDTKLQIKTEQMNSNETRYFRKVESENTAFGGIKGKDLQNNIIVTSRSNGRTKASIMAVPQTNIERLTYNRNHRKLRNKVLKDFTEKSKRSKTNVGIDDDSYVSYFESGLENYYKQNSELQDYIKQIEDKYEDCDEKVGRLKLTSILTDRNEELDKNNRFSKTLILGKSMQ